MSKYYMIGNTHFDPVWLWRWDEAMASIRATFRSALERMKEDAGFIYSFATPPVFEWIRRTDPEMFEEIRQRVAEGRWELAEGWWVQPDCYAASGESYVRQGLYGQRYLKEQFGKYSDCVFNIDSFGHSPMLPQILKKSGIDYYCFVRPEKRHIPLEHQLFVWASPDGSRILAYRAENAYEKDWKNSIRHQEENADALIVYGVTDHGGAPTKAAIAQINEDENAEFSTVSRFFREHDTDHVVEKELMTGDFGPYANYSKVKKLNRIGEYAVLNAEKASLIADSWGYSGKKDGSAVDSAVQNGSCAAASSRPGSHAAADQQALTFCWKDLLFNQFHDILGGACIKDAYTDAHNQQGRAIATANEILHYNLQALTRRIKTPGKNPDTAWNIAVWNLNGRDYDGYLEAEVQWVHEFDWYDKGICLEDGDGNPYPCQVIREKSVIPRFRSRFIFKAKIPAVGYKVFKLIQTGEEVIQKTVDPFEIKTDRLTVKCSRETGCIQSVTDHRTGKKLASGMFVPVCYEDKGDTWCFNINGYEEKAKYFQFEGFKVIEAGELMTEIKAVYTLGRSRLEMYYRFYAEETCFDVRYRVNWEEKHMVLKLETEMEEMLHRAAVPGGEVVRGENTADVPLGAWILADRITIAADSIFAYGMKDNKLGLTLLRSPIYGDLRLGELDEEIDYDIIDRGITEGAVRVKFDCADEEQRIGAAADQDISGTDHPWTMAEQFNNPPTVIIESNHDGDLPPAGSFYSMMEDDVQMTALKKCEDDDAVILRLAETRGENRNVRFTVNGITYDAQMTPYEIKTLKLAGQKAAEVNMLELQL